MSSTLEARPASTMADILEVFPGGRRALFRRYHLGGCSSCGFSPNETLAELCRRNGELDPEEVLAHLRDSHEQDQRLLMNPSELAQALNGEPRPHLLDIRSKEEWETGHIAGAVRLTQDNLQEIMTRWGKDELMVVCDHTGAGVLDAAAYFQGHGFTNVRCLRGGVDAWAAQVDPAMKRYRLQ